MFNGMFDVMNFVAARTMIVGIGIDLIEIARVERAARRNCFCRRVYTEREIADCRRGGEVSYYSLAARFAAKEAVFKALGCGWGLGWKSVEVVSDERGQPQVKLCGRAAQRAAELGVKDVKISLTHSRTCAGAVALAIGGKCIETGDGGRDADNR